MNKRKSGEGDWETWVSKGKLQYYIDYRGGFIEEVKFEQRLEEGEVSQVDS